MKKPITLFFFLFVIQFVYSQTVPSSCSAADSIKAIYNNDADRLVLRKLYSQHLADTNNIIISKSHSDTVLRALIAVYNATALPARNTVISQYNIHTFPRPKMNNLLVAADSTLPWMQQLKAGNIPTGNLQIDNLISTYYLTKKSYTTFFNSFSYHIITFKSDSNYNLPPLADLFENISGVSYAEPESYIGDGNDISATIFANYVELTYSYAWGDCPSGCIYRHYWNFRVYSNCSVEFIGEYGSALPPLPPSTPTISISGLNCINQTLTVAISGATSYSLNYMPLTVAQFTLSSPTPTYYIISANNGSSFVLDSVSIKTCFTAIEKNENSSTLSFYPNPVCSILNLEVDSPKSFDELLISDMLGRIVYKEDLKINKGMIKINVSTLQHGIYYLIVGAEVRKFVKE